MSELTPRQWRLYEFLKDNFSDDAYISKKDIALNVDGYDVNDKSTRYLRDIEFDVHDINNSEVIQKIIVSSHKGYKIGTPSQVYDYIMGRIIEAKNSLILSYKLKHKAELNNQYRLVFNTVARDLVEVYIKKEKFFKEISKK